MRRTAVPCLSTRRPGAGLAAGDGRPFRFWRASLCSVTIALIVTGRKRPAEFGLPPQGQALPHRDRRRRRPFVPEWPRNRQAARDVRRLSAIAGPRSPRSGSSGSRMRHSEQIAATQCCLLQKGSLESKFNSSVKNRQHGLGRQLPSGQTVHS